MSWRNNLQQASFRGAKFKVRSADTGVGRRTEMHVYPNTKKQKLLFPDWVWAEDLGAEPDEFVIEGYIIQTVENNFDYFGERDKLISAFKTEGPGKLKHPFYKNTIEVSVMGKARIIETFDEGGMAKFTVTFAQYNKPIFSGLAIDPTTLVDTSALDVINQALDSFTELMDTAGAFLGSLTAPLTTMMTKMQGAINSVKGAVASTISTALGIVSSAISLIDNLLDSPCALAGQILAAGDAILGLVGMAGDVVQGGIVGGCSGVRRGDITVMSGKTIPEEIGISAVQNLSDQSIFTVDEIETATIGFVPEEQDNNLELLATIQQSIMTANAATMAIRVEFTSQEQVVETSIQVTNAIDALIDRMGAASDEIDDSALFQTIVELRSTFVKSMLEKNVTLTKQIDYSVPFGVQSSLELAYNQYDDISRDIDIFKRNRVAVRHPGFLPSGDTVKILNE
jgi:prophage DNA circulation protein